MPPRSCPLHGRSGKIALHSFMDSDWGTYVDNRWQFQGSFSLGGGCHLMELEKTSTVLRPAQRLSTWQVSCDKRAMWSCTSEPIDLNKNSQPNLMWQQWLTCLVRIPHFTNEQTYWFQYHYVCDVEAKDTNSHTFLSCKIQRCANQTITSPHFES